MPFCRPCFNDNLVCIFLRLTPVLQPVSATVDEADADRDVEEVGTNMAVVAQAAEAPEAMEGVVAKVASC